MRENTLSSIQVVILDGQVASASMFDAVPFLFIQKIISRKASYEGKVNKKHAGKPPTMYSRAKV